MVVDKKGDIVEFLGIDIDPMDVKNPHVRKMLYNNKYTSFKHTHTDHRDGHDDYFDWLAHSLYIEFSSSGAGSCSPY